MLPDDPRHGTVNALKNLGCRCDRCVLATYRYEKRRKYLVSQGLGPTLPAHGFKRRVRALMANGWTMPELAAELGIAVGNLSIKLSKNTAVHRRTHEAMCEIYERLCMTIPVDPPLDGAHGVTRVHERTRAIAERKGWPRPLCWDDIDDINEEPTAGHARRNYSRDELLDEWDHLRRSGSSMQQAAERLGITVDAIEKAVERDRKETAA